MLFRSVVAVIAPRVFRNDGSAADLADERVAAGVGLIIAFFKGFAFVFAIHEILLLKMTLGPSGGMACVCICQTSRSAHTLQV